MRRNAKATSDHDQLQAAAGPSQPGYRSVHAQASQTQWPTPHICVNMADDGSRHLQPHVSTTAFDSDDKEDAPKCHSNTRQAVLDVIINWITIQTAIRTQWILWLNGAAGAGKSAIGRSIVEYCLSLDIPIARFFFFRTDSARNTSKPIVATLVYQ
ncbi:hypothetical protein HYPSUDRAFT_31449 [Hypholoma sublateritium FD-334 SS-4]|uniref:Nephrocystin 3-like N-terminal domain-containing protein n=1 Tax=Hypholoma sublateritium (strain FD-334 SS-4) TaxID=945553 RepID=A0A0D2PMM1_HYPSF|nr:hypothetical protein HYPSUDRAFT_31449 [Hypholoma sublateritium FD-334 SS-4]